MQGLVYMSRLNNFFVPGVEHVCRFCETPLAKRIGNVLSPLSNIGHVYLLLKSGKIHRFNCCKDCAKKKDFTEPGLLRRIWEGDCEQWKTLEEREGSCSAKEDCEARKKEDIVEDFFVRAPKLKDSKRAENKCKKKWERL